MNTNVGWYDLQKWSFGIQVIEGEKEMAKTSGFGELSVASSNDLSQGFIGSLSGDGYLSLPHRHFEQRYSSRFARCEPLGLSSRS